MHSPIKTAENHKLCIEWLNTISKQTKPFLKKEHDAGTAFLIQSHYLNERKNGRNF
jgi:uncharacterized protein YqfA (UPF0365 family)